ncbi:hypothetical protein JCM6882_000263 [Rhodosporidiobolus microsporus]
MHIGDYHRALGDLLEFDNVVGATLDRLKELGLDEDTLVVVTSDYGHGFDVFGSADTEFLRDQPTNATKRSAVGISRQSLNMSHRECPSRSQLRFDSAPGFGMQMIHSIDSTITDSANSATALTSGKKSTVNTLFPTARWRLGTAATVHAQLGRAVPPALRQYLEAFVAASAAGGAGGSVERGAALSVGELEDSKPEEEAGEGVVDNASPRRARSLGAEPPDAKPVVKPEDDKPRIPSPLASASPAPRSPAPSPSPSPGPKPPISRDTLNPWLLASLFPSLAPPPELMSTVFAEETWFIRQRTVYWTEQGLRGSWSEISGGNSEVLPNDFVMCLSRAVNGPQAGAGHSVVALVSHETRAGILSTKRSWAVFITVVIDGRKVNLYYGAYVEAARFKWTGTRLARASPDEVQAWLDLFRTMGADRDHLRNKLEQWGVKNLSLTDPQQIWDALIDGGDSTAIRFSILCCVGFKPNRVAVLMERRAKRLEAESWTKQEKERVKEEEEEQKKEAKKAKARGAKVKAVKVVRRVKEFSLPRPELNGDIEESEEEIKVKVDAWLLPTKSEQDDGQTNSGRKAKGRKKGAGKAHGESRGKEEKAKGRGEGGWKAKTPSPRSTKRKATPSSSDDSDDDGEDNFYASSDADDDDADYVEKQQQPSKKPRRTTRSSSRQAV